MGGTNREVSEHHGRDGQQSLSEHDLWRARAINRGQLSVELVFWQGGEEQTVEQVWGPCLPDMVTCGEQSRQLAVWEAVARYRNAGGDLYEFGRALARLPNSRLVPAAGMVLFETTQEVSEAQYVWVNPSANQVLVFNEDVYVERMTVPELYRHVNMTRDKRRRLSDGVPESLGADDPADQGEDPA